MIADWAELSVSDVCTRVTSGGTPSRKIAEYFGGQIPWLKTQELRDTWVDSAQESITDAGLANSSAKLLPAHTVVMAMYGATVGKLAILRTPMTCNQAACAMVVNPERADYRFLFYSLLNDRRHIIDLAVGAAQQNLSAATIKALRFRFPDVDVQRAISATLGALDDKIASNRCAAALCLDLGEATFGQASAGAEKKMLGSIATVVLGGTPNRKEPSLWGGSIPWINSGSANRSVILSPSEFITEEGLSRSSAKLMPAGATVVAITGATLGQVALLGGAMSGNQSLVGIWGDDDDLTAWLHYSIRSEIPILLGSATGAAQQHVNKGMVEQLAVPIASRDELLGWASIGRPLLERAVSLERESIALAELRDALLPELIAGRMRVAEEVGLEAVA